MSKYLKVSDYKEKAKKLVDKSTKLGIKLSHSQSLELIAFINGFKDWNSFVATILKLELKNHKGLPYNPPKGVIDNAYIHGLEKLENIDFLKVQNEQLKTALSFKPLKNISILNCTHKNSTDYNGEVVWCIDCGAKWLISDVLKSASQVSADHLDIQCVSVSPKKYSELEMIQILQDKQIIVEEIIHIESGVSSWIVSSINRPISLKEQLVLLQNSTSDLYKQTKDNFNKKTIEINNLSSYKFVSGQIPASNFLEAIFILLNKEQKIPFILASSDY